MDVYQRRRLVALAGAAAIIGLIVAIASAGGDGGSNPTPATTASTQAMTKNQFILSADSICAETATSIANLTGADPADDAQRELDFSKSQYSQIRSLPQPDEDKAELESFLAALKDQIQSLSKQAQAAKAGSDLTAIQTQLDSAEANVRTTAEAYGLTRCGKPGVASAGGGGSGGTSTTTVPPATTTPATTPPETPAAPPAPAGGGTDTGGGGTGGDTGGGSGGSGGVGPG